MKFTLIAVFFGVTSFLLVAILSHRFTSQEFEEHHREKALLIWTHILHDMEQGMLHRTHDIITGTINFYRGFEDIREVRVFDCDGKEVFTKIEGPPDPKVKEALQKKEFLSYRKGMGEKEMSSYVIPIRNKPECRGCHQKHGEDPIGAVLLSISLKGMKANISRQNLRFSILIALISVGIIVGASIAVNRLFLKPLRRIQEGTEAIGKGELSHRVPVISTDEIGSLADHFNRMSQGLNEKNEALWEQFRLVSRSQKEWQETFDSITDLVAVMDRDFNILRANRAYQKHFSLPLHEVLNRRCTDLCARCLEADVLHLGMLPDRTPIISELPDVRTGKIFQVSLYPLYLPEEGIHGSVCVAKDITEHKQADEALRESETKFRKLSQEFNTLLDAMPDSLALLSSDLQVLWTNRAAALRSGMEVSDLIGKYCYKLWYNPSDPCKECQAKKSFLTGEVEGDQISTPDGKIWDVRAFPIKDEAGKVINVIEVATDITEKLTLQAEAIRAGHLASLGELAAGVAHEINNPINGIINYAQILLNKMGKESRERDIADRIITEGDRIATIVRNLLSFSRDRGEERSLVQVRDILSESLALTEVQIAKEGIHLKVDVLPDLPPIVAHSQQIQQVFLNILNNARYALSQKYPSRDPEKILKITCQRINLEGKTYVRVTFHDQGMGIPTELIHKVMNPFFTTKPTGKGTGLGLSISHGIVADHGGRLSIASVEGAFTETVVDLPAVE